MQAPKTVTNIFHRFMRMKLAESDARVRLMVCLRDDQVDFIFNEVNRRTRVIRKAWGSTRVPHTKSAKHAALDSVYNDVVRGYLI